MGNLQEEYNKLNKERQDLEISLNNQAMWVSIVMYLFIMFAFGSLVYINTDSISQTVFALIPLWIIALVVAVVEARDRDKWDKEQK